jgi:LysR family glycine cleavage system transcriptional activator
MNKRRYPRLSLDLLRGFRVAARHLSFTRAARELFVTPSAISREIKTLEEQIGQPLFQRIHRALQLTHAGEELYRVADEALAQLDAVTDRLCGSARALTVTTTTALASLWLAPRLPRFNRLSPEIDVRIVATNDKPDLEREQLDIAIQFVPAGRESPSAEQLMPAVCFPVCSPMLARDPARPLRVLDDLALHVRLDYEGARDGRRFSEWDFWFDAMHIPVIKPASTLRFSQYDQWVPAAIEGAGVAIGVLPHLTQQLRDGVLYAPFGGEAIAKRGSFFLVFKRDVAERDTVKSFVDWLRSEVLRDGELTFEPPRVAKRQTARRTRTSDARTRAHRP